MKDNTVSLQTEMALNSFNKFMQGLENNDKKSDGFIINKNNKRTFIKRTVFVNDARIENKHICVFQISTKGHKNLSFKVILSSVIEKISQQEIIINNEKFSSKGNILGPDFLYNIEDLEHKELLEILS